MVNGASEFVDQLAIAITTIVFNRTALAFAGEDGVAAVSNKISFLTIKVENSKCVGCNQCVTACKMDVDVCKTPNHPECIRCGACIKACPKDAIHYQFMGKNCQKKKLNSQ